MAKISYSRVFVWLVLSNIIFSANSFAQNPSNYYEEEPRIFFGGLVAGVNFTQVDGDSYAGYHKIGLNAGGIMYAQLADHLAASLELLFSQKGSHSNGSQDFNKLLLARKYDIALNYAEIPIQLNYFDKRKSHFGAGFSFSQLISAKETLTSEPSVAQDTLDKYKFNKSAFDFILGGNLHIWRGFFLNLRFQYSIFAIRKNGDIYSGLRNGARDQFSNMWTVRIMYLF